jgi:hypothetical protein
MRSGMEGISVGLHEVHLSAPSSTNIVGITVVVTTLSWSSRSISIFSRHFGKIESGIAGASRGRKLNVPLDVSTHKGWVIEIVRAKSISVSKVTSTIMRNLDFAVLNSGVPITTLDNIFSHGFTILFNLDCLESSSGS